MFNFSILHLGWNLKLSWFQATLSNLEWYSIQITKIRGDIGSPCQIPLLDLHKGMGLPFKIRENYAMLIQIITIFMKWQGKFSASNISLIKSHSKVLCDFRKWIFNELLSGQCFLPYCFTISWHKRILCMIASLHKGTLRRTNDLTKNQFKSAANQFSNAFI